MTLLPRLLIKSKFKKGVILISLRAVQDELCSLSMRRKWLFLSSRVQKFPAWHTKAAPNGKCCEGYIVPSIVRLMYQLKSVLK